MQTKEAKAGPSKATLRERVRLAKDVIKQIDEGFIHPVHGTYVALANSVNPKSRAQLCNVLKRQPAAPCVCAQGAFFIARVMRHDALTVAEAFGDAWIWNGHVDHDAMVTYMARVFDRQTFRHIEHAFEVTWRSRHVDLSPSRILRAICRNVIDNKGRFKEHDYRQLRAEAEVSEMILARRAGRRLRW